jgi:hypothetical protein
MNKYMYKKAAKETTKFTAIISFFSSVSGLAAQRQIYSATPKSKE